jgi:cytochrome c oxidase cbb3-type subunit 3
VGRISQGAANLTDSIWTIADVPGQATLEGKKAVVKRVIANGVNRKMPAWKNRLNDTEVKILTFYVHELGGGN